MNVLVWMLPGVLALFAWAIVATLRASRENVLDRRETNVALYRQRRAEIAEAGVEDAEALERELGVQLATDEADELVEAGEVPNERLGFKPSLAVAATISLVTVLLYFLLGDPSADALKPVRSLVESEDPADWLRAERLLVDRTTTAHENADVWFYLGHLRFKQERYDEAAAAFRRVTVLAGPSENVDLFLAQSLFIANQGALGDEGREIVNRVLGVGGDQAWALELLALDAARRSDVEGAIRYSSRILGVPLPTERRAMFQEMERQLRARLPGNGALVAATVDVTGRSRFPWLFVTARDLDGGPPIVAVRRAIRGAEGPVEVVLDDLVSMMPSNLLSTHAEVDVEARLSTSNRAVDPDAEELRSGIVRVAPNARTRVELIFPDAPARTGDVALEVRLEIDEAFVEELDGPKTVFVIVRGTSGGPPLAVKKVLVSSFPVDVVVTDADVMLPGNSLALSNDISVMARLSQTGDAMPAPGDIQSDSLRHDDLRKPLTVVLRRQIEE